MGSSKMSVNNLKSNLSNPARDYLFDVIIPNPIGGGDAETLLLRAQSASLPGRGVGVIKVPYKQSAGINFHGKLTYGQAWQVTFVEGEDGRVFDILHAWNQNIIHDVANVGIGDVFIQQDIIFNCLTTRGETWRQIVLKNAFPSNVSDVPMGYDNQQVVRYSVTWTYDSWEKK
jgi:hypothetical protein